MATRRRYKSAPVEADVLIEDNSAPASSAVAPAPAPPPAASPLMAQVAAQRNAERLQRENAERAPVPQPMTVEQHIDAMPGLSDHKRAFLKAHPRMLEIAPVMAKHYHEGIRSGLQDDTPELDEHILRKVADEITKWKALTGPGARQTEENRSNHEYDRVMSLMDADIEREQERQRAAHHPEPSAPASPEVRRTIPMSAPVSRAVPTASGARSSQITLSPEERQIANISFKHLPQHQRELEYAKNKRLMVAMQQDGRLPRYE